MVRMCTDIRCCFFWKHIMQTWKSKLKKSLKPAIVWVLLYMWCFSFSIFFSMLFYFAVRFFPLFPILYVYINLVFCFHTIIFVVSLSLSLPLDCYAVHKCSTPMKECMWLLFLFVYSFQSNNMDFPLWHERWKRMNEWIHAYKKTERIQCKYWFEFSDIFRCILSLFFSAVFMLVYVRVFLSEFVYAFNKKKSKQAKKKSNW